MIVESNIVVPTISCNHCKGAIEGAVGRLEGVTSVTVDIEQKRVVVSLDDALVDRGSIIAAIEDAGYAVPEPVRPASSGGCCG